jgi:hypothetical protein
MATYNLKKWSVGFRNPFLPPELQGASLVGYRDGEDKPVITSAIVKAEGRNITTFSGSVYILEDIDPEYEAWLISQGIKYDPENPVKFKKVVDKNLN